MTGLRRYNKKTVLASFAAVTLLIIIFATGHVTVHLTIMRPLTVISRHMLFWNVTSNKSSSVNADDTNVVLFPTKSLVIWSNDFHISPIADLKNLLQPLGVRFIDKSLSGHCHVTGTCEGRKTLRVINQGNAMDLSDPSLFKKFYESYKDDPEMKSVDAFVCFHPTAMCELFAQFNKTLLIIASTRYELGRFGRERWSRWNENLVRYASIPGNVVGGNNLYDVEYIRYFTGLENVRLLPSYCGYRPEKYSPSRPGFLLAPIHNGGFGDLFWKWFEKSRQSPNVNASRTLLSSIRSLYPHYQYADLAAHPGIVYAPYQVSVMSLFEQYRMNIPLWFPSVRLLADWQLQHQVMNERTWDAVFGRRPEKSAIEAHPSQRHLPDPNDERHLGAIEYWIKFADFYQMPYIRYYDSMDDLVKQLTTVSHQELLETSKMMAEFNARAKQDLVEKWTEILRKIAAISPNKPH